MNLIGKFSKIIFNNKENGYTVALLLLKDSSLGEEVVTVGYIGHIDRDKYYQLEGQYVSHPKYGIQFSVDSYQKVISENNDDLIKYFSSSQFKGIGKKMASAIVETLGEKAISKIQNDNDVLDTISGMNEKKKQSIIDGLKQETDDDIVFLKTHFLSIKNIVRLKNRYKDDLMNILTSDPYRVITEVDGIGFNTIDKFALSIGFNESDFKRLCSYSESFLLNQCMRSGDSYLLLDDFCQSLEAQLFDYDCDVKAILSSLASDRRIAIEQNRIYHISQYDSENYISSYLASFPFEEVKKFNDETIEKNLAIVEKQTGIAYQDKQLEAIKSFCKEDIMIITGGPGTGKTTIVEAMIKMSHLLYPYYNVVLAGPTGRSAKRLTQLTNNEAKTIHSLLLWNKESGKFAKDEENPLTIDILIIDEFSMVDQYLFYNLLKAGSYFKKIIMIGDVDQLPSVSIGAVLRDLIASNLIKTVKLERIYRQKKGSDIITLAHKVKDNICDDIPIENDIRFFQCDKTQIQQLTLQVVEKALSNYDSIEEGFMNVQVLAPKHQGLNGITSLNVALQNAFNPKDKRKRELTVGYKTYRVGDKVLQLKNQPDDDVYNGDIGTIVEIIYTNEDVNGQNRIVVDFDGRIVEYTNENFENITHGYCMSVHKAQGSEYPIVVMPMSNEYGIMLQKRLIYTAITRAYRSLIFIGDKTAFFSGINRIDSLERNTTLKEKFLKKVELIDE